MTGSRIERWRPIPGWPGYEASSLGRLRARRPTARQGRAILQTPPRVMTGHIEKDGRRRINLTLAGRRKKVIVGHLVCLAFHGRAPAGCGAEHRNGDLADDRARNLRWATEAVRCQSQHRRLKQSHAPKPRNGVVG